MAMSQIRDGPVVAGQCRTLHAVTQTIDLAEHDRRWALGRLAKIVGMHQVTARFGIDEADRQAGELHGLVNHRTREGRADHAIHGANRPQRQQDASACAGQQDGLAHVEVLGENVSGAAGLTRGLAT